MRFVLLGLVLVLSGCFQLNQCQQNADCPMTSDGKKQFCTADNLCTIGTPTDKMCTDSYPRPVLDGAVPIGVILDPRPKKELLYWQALQVAVDDINSVVTGSGFRRLALYLCDNSGTPDDTLKAFRYLAREKGVVAVVGPTASGAVLAVAGEAGQDQVPLVSPSSTSPTISGHPQAGQYVFRVAPSDVLQGKVLARVVQNMSPNANPTFMHSKDSYGTGLRDAFLPAWAAFMHDTSKLPVFSFTDEMNSKDVATAVTSVRNQSPQPTDVVVVAYQEAAEIAKDLSFLPLKMMAADPPSSNIWMTDGAKSSDLLGVAMPGAHFQRIRGTAPTAAMNTSPGFSAFYNGFKGHFPLDNPNDDAYSAYSYDALYAIAIAMANGKQAPTGPLIAAGLKRIAGTAMDTPIAVGPSNFLQAANQMAQGKAVPLSGASGEIRFDMHGDRQNGLFEVWSIVFSGSTPSFKSDPAPM